MTGYWKQRGFFTAYVAGKVIGRFPTPEQALQAIGAIKAKGEAE